jgi:prophage regulatory protein
MQSHSISEATTMSTDPLDRVLRWREVRDLVPLSRSTIWRMTRNGRFPRPVQLSSAASVGWLRSEIDDWVRERTALRDRTTNDK